jgi:hypothetical protein
VPDRAPLPTPYRRAAALTWRSQPRLRLYTALAALLGVAGVVGALAADPLLWLLAGLGVMIGVPVAVGWVAQIGRATWRLRRSYAGRPAELATVRARRLQAGEEDRTAPHDQFAVTAEDDGWLITWRFRPLAAGEEPVDHEIEVPGRTRFAASPVADAPFDIQDAARAAEQLFDAQEAAARRESAAAESTETQVERALEAGSTAAALQRTTGQRARREKRGRGRR